MGQIRVNTAILRESGNKSGNHGDIFSGSGIAVDGVNATSAEQSASNRQNLSNCRNTLSNINALFKTMEARYGEHYTDAKKNATDARTKNTEVFTNLKTLISNYISQIDDREAKLLKEINTTEDTMQQMGALNSYLSTVWEGMAAGAFATTFENVRSGIKSATENFKVINSQAKKSATMQQENVESLAKNVDIVNQFIDDHQVLEDKMKAFMDERYGNAQKALSEIITTVDELDQSETKLITSLQEVLNSISKNYKIAADNAYRIRQGLFGDADTHDQVEASLSSGWRA